MQKLNNKSGFTLLEILVVIIIVGVLASVAMPALFRNVERSRSAEAFTTMGVIKAAIEGCAVQNNGNAANCSNYDAIGVPNPSNAGVAAPNGPGGVVSSHWDYTYTDGVAPAAACAAVGGALVGGAPVQNAPTSRIVATRVALDNGVVGDLVCLDRDTGGNVVRSGTTAFAGIR